MIFKNIVHELFEAAKCQSYKLEIFVNGGIVKGFCRNENESSKASVCECHNGKLESGKLFSIVTAYLEPKIGLYKLFIGIQFQFGYLTS